MTLEIEVTQVVRVRWQGREHRLEPGCPIPLPERQAVQLLSKAPQMVKPTPPVWLFSWRLIAGEVSGVPRDDARFQPLQEALGICDEGFLSNDWGTFCRGWKQLQQVRGNAPRVPYG